MAGVQDISERKRRRASRTERLLERQTVFLGLRKRKCCPGANVSDLKRRPRGTYPVSAVIAWSRYLGSICLRREKNRILFQDRFARLHYIMITVFDRESIFDRFRRQI